MITTQLNHERVGLAAWSGLRLRSCTKRWPAWAAPPSPPTARRARPRWVQSDLARCRPELEAMYLLNWRMAAAVATETMSPADSSTVKIFGVERSIDIYRRLLGIVGAAATSVPARPGRCWRAGSSGPPAGPDQHLRRRRQRDPARDRGHGRPGHDPGGAVSAVARTAPTPRQFRGRTAPTGSSTAAGRLRGQVERPPIEARDDVNQAMIRHWVDAMGDENPVYIDDAGGPGQRASRGDRPAHHAPGLDHARLPTSQPGESRRAASEAGRGPRARSDVRRPRRGRVHLGGGHRTATRSTPGPSCSGDRLTVSSVIDSVSPEKHTGLGVGHFVTTRLEFTDQHGERGGHHAVPHPALPAPAARTSPRPRPRPAAAPSGAHPRQRLLLRRGPPGRSCSSSAARTCGVLRHPPRPACPSCRSFEWDTVEASGPGDGLQLRGRAPSPGSRLRLPAAHRRGRARGGDPPGGRPDRASTPPTCASACPVVVELVAVDDELTMPDVPTRSTASRGRPDGLHLHRGAAGGGRGPPRRSSPAWPRPERVARSRGTARPLRRARCGPSWPRPTCSAWPSPRTTADRASA